MVRYEATGEDVGHTERARYPKDRIHPETEVCGVLRVIANAWWYRQKAEIFDNRF